MDHYSDASSMTKVGARMKLKIMSTMRQLWQGLPTTLARSVCTSSFLHANCLDVILIPPKKIRVPEKLSQLHKKMYGGHIQTGTREYATIQTHRPRLRLQ